MWKRRLAIFVTLVVILVGQSCTTYRSTVKDIYMPSKYELEMAALADTLSDVLNMSLTHNQDDLGLYSFVADWIGTPYRFGQNSKKGTDCSGFAYALYLDVYNTNITRSSSADLMSKSKRVGKQDLQEGDLVFFNINNRRGGRASHVGVYLKEDKFAHATTRRGVIISSLNEPYYSRTYIGAGRVNK